MEKQLENNEEFKKLQEELEKQGFNKTQTKFNQLSENKTQLTTTFQNQNQTAEITAEFENNTLKKVELKKQDPDNKNNAYYWTFAIIALLSLFVCFIAYKKFLKKKAEIIEATPKKAFDYISASKKLLEQAKTLFSKQKFKDAYGKASESIRLYLSHKHGIKAELTNTETIKQLKKLKLKHESTQECLNLCAMVEFVKYKANKEDFNKIISLANRIIK